MDQPLRVIAVTRKPGSASFERRVLDYLPLLADRGVRVHVEELPRHFFEQRGFLRHLHAYDLIWWHRHLLHTLLMPRLPMLRPPILFDYDEPLIYSYRDYSQPSLTRRLRFAAMLRRSRLTLAASEPLRQIGLRYCRRVAVQPTPVPAPAAVRPISQRRPHSLLWLGSAVMQEQLAMLRGPLDSLALDRGVVLRLVAPEPMSFGLLRVDHRPWTPTEQSAALQECVIGLDPSPDTPMARGKCSQRVLQYMAHGMPFIGSAPGENCTAAGNGARGLCATNPREWVEALKALLSDPGRCDAMGEAGRAYVRREHALPTLADQLAQRMRKMAKKVS